MNYFWIILPWIISCITITSMWLAGNKSPKAWSLGLFNQVLWAAVMINAELWGLLPISVFLTITYTRNYIKWKKESK